ncbi:MAG: hypothetical protein IT323_08900 [Anaerolineae bacterium]|nr:hypothetical protein [Anaerolineae bacterium]
MSISRYLYNVLAEVLHDCRELAPNASLLQTDHAIVKHFGVSESTARNWRRGRYYQIAPSTLNSIVDVCNRLAPERVPDLEFVGRLLRGTQGLRQSAERLVDQLTSEVFRLNTTWHIYSGPLKVAFDLDTDAERRKQLMSYSRLVVERILELGLDRSDIPCVDELIRYSTHGWYVTGNFHVREAGLSSAEVGISPEYIGAVEAALYIGDGCVGPCLYAGDTERAKRYIDQALHLLQSSGLGGSGNEMRECEDATVMLRGLQAVVACHEGMEANQPLIDSFTTTFEHQRAENDWIEGMRNEALGYVELARRVDYAKAAFHFERARRCQDQWLSSLGVPISGTSAQSLSGYAQLMLQGSTDSVKLQLSEGLLRANDLGSVTDQVRARLCQAVLYDCCEDHTLANYHREKAASLVQQYGLQRWYRMLNHILVGVERGGMMGK